MSCRRYAQKARVMIVETEALAIDEEHSDSLIHMHEPLLPHRLMVSSISIRRDARRIPLHERATLYRDGRRKCFSEVGGNSPRGSRRYGVTRVVKR